jgi:RNA polymerase sigma factor (sigma-70 family)
MQRTEDSALLRQYAENHSGEAFAELVKRHVNLVYSVALRHAGDPHHAEEITQGVFITLAKKAIQLRHDKALSSWLFQATRLTASNFARSETRRHRREQEAYMQSVLNEPAGNPWPSIAPFLDDAVAGLCDQDRRAIVLRFYEGRNLREVGEAMGASEAAAEKRVNRAVEKLRMFLAQRGVTAGTSGLAATISAHAVQAAPAGLAATISAAAALGGTTLVTTATATTTQAIAMTTLQKTALIATMAAAVGMGIYEAHQASTLRARIQTLQQQQSPLSNQLAELKAENERLSNLVAQSKSAEKLPQSQFSELLKLRGNATLATTDARELAALKSKLEQKSAEIPDFLTNAMATGVSSAEKWKLKDATARLANMKRMLNLTDDQAQAIGEVMTNHIQRQTQLMLESMLGKVTPEQQQARAGSENDHAAEITALLTPDQRAAYPEYLQAEKATAADNSARSEASRLADDFKLSTEQQEKLKAALHEMKLRESDNSLNLQAITQATQSGNLANVANMSVELQKAQLEEKLKILEDFLTPEQMTTYRGEQLDRIDQQAAAMKLLLPRRPVEGTN